KKVEELMVSGTGTTEEERQEAISNAIEKIDEIINSISL
ncbi:MAG: FMN-dependent NADH-azoreductase, partial [Peptostreptococcaceae bacterium]|nr:FMN-dependent NADH-azoreductase [Peptostreptococcaceae bacterium]